jgi:phospholipid-binding lipoprotein MlaA
MAEGRVVGARLLEHATVALRAAAVQPEAPVLVRFPHFLRGLGAVALLLAFSACATPPPVTEPEARAEFEATNDRLEPLNRAIFTANEAADTLLIRPAAEFYRLVLPEPLRDGVRNVLSNLRGTNILLHDLLQGEGERAARTAERLIINTTLGLGGIFDVAADHFDRPGHDEDFGQTLAVWGTQEGFYLVLPLLGPSNARDALGFAVDTALNPWAWIGQGPVVDGLRYGRTAATLLDARTRAIDPLDRVYESSLDPYATLRSAYRQRREAAIRNQDSPGEGR